MKIVVTGTRGIPNILGGIETHCEELFPRMMKDGMEIVIMRRTQYVRDTLNSYKGITLCNIDAPQKKSFEAIIHTFKCVWNARFRQKADILHIHGIGPALLVPIARIFGLKVVFTHHGFDYDREKWNITAKMMLRLGEFFGTKFSNEVIAISEHIRNVLAFKYHRQDIHLIYNGVPFPSFIIDESYLNLFELKSHKYLFAMGRFVPEKRFDDLITAFSLLKQEEYKLVIAGDTLIEDSYSEKLKMMAKEAGVILPGFIKGKNLECLLTHAKGFVIPSSHEGLPIALLEAMSYNLPVIASDIPANRSVGLDESCYFKLFDKSQLTQKLNGLIHSSLDRKVYDMANYDWSNIAEKTLGVYNKLLK